jgi:hypothetical protein
MAILRRIRRLMSSLSMIGSASRITEETGEKVDWYVLVQRRSQFEQRNSGFPAPESLMRADNV